MNRSIFHFTAVLSIFLLAGAGCLGGGQSESQPSENNQKSVSQEFSGSLAEALKLGKSLKCTWSSDEGSGVSYIKGERVRSEVEIEGMQSYIIGGGDCTYIWEQGSAEGIEFCVGEEDFGVDASEFEGQASGDSFTGPDPDVEVNCQATTVSDSMFEPPSDVTFTNPFEDLFNF